MDKSYEKLTPEHYKSELEPFIARKSSLSPMSNPWLHWHESVEFLRCIEGSGKAIVNGCEYSFDKDDVIAVNSGYTHLLNVTDSSVNYAYLVIHPKFLVENGIDPQVIRLATHIHDKKACELFDNAIECYNAQNDFTALKTRTSVQRFLLHVFENHLSFADEQNELSSIDEIKKTVNYIRNNYSRDITLQTAADIAGFSVCYFSRKFKKVTGQTFVTFLNLVRCENADRLLKSGAKVADVCYECGFSDPSYFSRTFKNLMGYAPSSAGKK